jgi:gentisate 1,2-dioxygenase
VARLTMDFARLNPSCATTKRMMYSGQKRHNNRRNEERLMSPPSQADLARAASLEELYGKLDKVGMGPGWNKPMPSLWPAPRKTFVPAHWKYEFARGALDAAGRLINTALAERRNLILFNPAEGNSYGTVRTLVAAYQMIMPGEWARVHRHTPNALRLILDADPGTYTEVDGVNIAMEPGDVLLTPNWSTHGHGNRSKACAYWLDFLDAPLVQLLEPMFFEAVEDEENEEGTHGEEPASMTTDSPFVFTLKDTLRRLAEAEPMPSGPFATQIELGHPALATTALYMMQLRPGVPTAPYRTTANNIYAVVRGEGATAVDGQRFQWRRGDVVAAPAWRPHWHKADGDAILFRVTDEPVMQRFGWWREEPPAAATAH